MSSNSSQWGQDANLFTEVLLTEYTPDTDLCEVCSEKNICGTCLLQIIDVSRLLPAKGLTARPLPVALEKCYLLLKDITVSAAFLSGDHPSGLTIWFFGPHLEIFLFC